MALTTVMLKRAGRHRLPAYGIGRWLPIAVRAALGAYLAVVILAHVVTLDTLLSMRETSCEPSSCLPGQLNPNALATLANWGIAAKTYALIGTGIALLIPIVGHALAAVTIWQRPTNALPGLFVFSLAICTINASGAFYVLAVDHPGWEFRIRLLLIPSLVSLFLLVLLFPDGRFVPRWSPLLLVFPFLDVFSFLYPSAYDRLPGWVASVHRWSEEWGYVAMALIVLWRLHVTRDPLARRQTRIWLMAQVPLWTFVAAMNLAGDDSLLTSGQLVTMVVEIAWALSIVFVLGGFLMAIYLYNAYDLRLVVSRSLVYALLSASLIALYVMVVGAVSLLSIDAGSAVSTVFATSMIAVAFAPMRTWLQRLTAKLLYGERDDPYGVLTRFGRQIEQGTAPEQLAHAIVSLAQDALRVPGVALGIDQAPSLDVTIGTVPPGATVLPVTYRGDPLGTLRIAPRGPGEAFSSRDRRLLEDIARQIGIAAHTVLLSDDLRQSRERIVTAREEERRRIRRDLHDGLGPSLAALALQVEIARDAITTDPDRSRALLDEALTQTRDAIVDIRGLVYELRPPALDDLGLLGAVRSQASRYDHDHLNVRLDLPDTLPPLSAAVEVAVFRIVQEALTNVVRHANATSAEIRFACQNDQLRVTVRDDGDGISPGAARGIGLRSMQERAAELGGTCDVRAMDGGGSLVQASFAILPASERTAS